MSRESRGSRYGGGQGEARVGVEGGTEVGSQGDGGVAHARIPLPAPPAPSCPGHDRTVGRMTLGNGQRVRADETRRLFAKIQGRGSREAAVSVATATSRGLSWPEEYLLGPRVHSIL